MKVIVTNPTREKITLPTGTVIDGPTEVSVGLLAHTDNADYVTMLLNKGRLEVTGTPSLAQPIVNTAPVRTINEVSDEELEELVRDLGARIAEAIERKEAEEGV
jgi:hypothetical protein